MEPGLQIQITNLIDDDAPLNKVLVPHGIHPIPGIVTLLLLLECACLDMHWDCPGYIHLQEEISVCCCDCHRRRSN